MKYAKEFIEEVKKFTPAQLEAVEIVSEYITPLLSASHLLSSREYMHTSDLIDAFIKNIENDTSLYYLIECMEEEHRVSFEYYISSLEKKYPEFFVQCENGAFKYDLEAAEQKKKLDKELAWEEWKKENPYYENDEIPF